MEELAKKTKLDPNYYMDNIYNLIGIFENPNYNDNDSACVEFCNLCANALKEQGININTRFISTHGTGGTLLMEAIKCNKINTVKSLLSREDIDSKEEISQVFDSIPFNDEMLRLLLSAKTSLEIGGKKAEAHYQSPSLSSSNTSPQKAPTAAFEQSFTAREEQRRNTPQPEEIPTSAISNNVSEQKFIPTKKMKRAGSFDNGPSLF